ncbi:MAG: hypothetical protein U0572_13480 [Phycisphaerales bacterium]
MRTLLQARHLSTWIAVAILVALLVLGGARFDHFLSGATVSGLFAEYAFLGIAAVGATIVILTGGIDLSVGSVVAATSTLVAALVERHAMHPLAAALIAVALGVAFGSINGVLIARMALPPFLVTLAAMFAARALGFMVAPQSMSIRHPFCDWASRDATIALGGGASIPFRTMIFIAVVVVAFVMLHATRLGRSIYAIGGNERSARLMGVPVDRVKISTYAIAGGCSALAGVVFALYKQAGDPASATGLELEAIAATVIGGTLLSGGVGLVLGTVIGVLILGTIRLLIDFQGNLNAAWTSIASGALLLAFVAMQLAIASIARRWATR